MKKIPLCVVCLLFCVVIAFAHPGSTDGNGGHYNRSTGEYHYHHGYPAHQHPNGVCPYDYHDRTGWDSGTSGSGSSSRHSPTVKYQPETDTSSQSTRTELPEIIKLILKHPILSLIFLALITGWIILFAQRLRAERILGEHGGVAKIASQFRVDMAELYERKRLCASQFSGIVSGSTPALLSNPLSINNASPSVRFLRRFYHVPYDAYINRDGNPASIIIHGNFDIYTVWINSQNTIYHNSTCYYASRGRPISVYCLPHNARPCAKCRPRLPDMSWVAPYREALDALSVIGVHEISPHDL